MVMQGDLMAVVQLFSYTFSALKLVSSKKNLLSASLSSLKSLPQCTECLLYGSIVKL